MKRSIAHIARSHILYIVPRSLSCLSECLSDELKESPAAPVSLHSTRSDTNLRSDSYEKNTNIILPI